MHGCYVDAECVLVRSVVWECCDCVDICLGCRSSAWCQVLEAACFARSQHVLHFCLLAQHK